jgi:hypothetical protein
VANYKNKFTVKTKTFFLSLFLALSSATLQAQHNNIVGQWHFPEKERYVTITETHIYGFPFWIGDENESMQYRIVGRSIMFFNDDSDFYEENFFHFFFRQRGTNRLELWQLGQEVEHLGYKVGAKTRSDFSVAPLWWSEWDTTQYARVKHYWESAEGWQVFSRNGETGEYYLQRTRFFVSIFYSDYCQDYILSVGGGQLCPNLYSNLFFIRGLPPSDNPVKTLAIPIDEMREERAIVLKSGKSHTFDFNGKTYTLRAEGEINEHGRDWSHWDSLKNFRIYLSDEQDEQLLTTIEEFVDTVPFVFWIGDLDGDGLPDFAIRTETWFEDERIEVFLSSVARGRNLVESVGEAWLRRAC